MEPPSLEEIRAALLPVQPEIAIISQAYDEFHHLAACDLTYEGGTRAVLQRCARGEACGADLARYWNQSRYSFPHGSLRLRWLDEKEQPRANALLGDALFPAAAVLFALDGVPHLLMGQEFGESGWRDWSVLFDDFRLDWKAFDARLFAHYQRLIALRRGHAALRQGDVAFLDGLPPGVIGFTRGAGGEELLVLANMAAVAAALPPAAMPAAALAAMGWDAGCGTLAAHGWVIGRLDQAGGAGQRA